MLEEEATGKLCSETLKVIYKPSGGPARIE